MNAVRLSIARDRATMPSGLAADPIFAGLTLKNA
jgi:hypothetical protein